MLYPYIFIIHTVVLDSQRFQQSWHENDYFIDEVMLDSMIPVDSHLLLQAKQFQLIFICNYWTKLPSCHFITLHRLSEAKVNFALGTNQAEVAMKVHV